MKKLISIDGVEIIQKNFQQVLIRGDGKEKFNQIINKEISILPPSKNLEVVKNNSYLFAKNSFDQWSLIYLEEIDYSNILNSFQELILMMKFLPQTILMVKFILKFLEKKKICF